MKTKFYDMRSGWEGRSEPELGWAFAILAGLTFLFIINGII